MNFTLIGALLLGAPALKEKPQTELVPTGAWEAVSNTQNGNDILASVKGLTLSFDGETMILKMGTIDQLVRVPVSFDANTKQKEVNFHFHAPTAPALGIYKIEGDTLTICLNEKTDGPRPTDFKSEAQHITLVVLKRLKK